MDSRVRDLNRELKSFDRKYFAKRNDSGKIFIAKKETFALYSPVSFCFALTDDWSGHGRPRDIGIVPILHKLRYGEDPFKVFADLDRQEKEEEASKLKAAASSAKDYAERMLFDARRAWSDVNTSCMDKKKVTKHGHYE